MAVADRTLMLKLIADVNQPTKAVKGLGSSLKKMGSAAKSWGKAFTGALVIGGIEKVVDSLDDAMAAFKDEQDVTRALGQTWKNLGRDAGQLGGIIDRLGGTAVDFGFDDAEVLRAFNTFLAKSGSVKDSTQGVQAAMNLARAKGISFARAVKIIGTQLGDLDPALKRNRKQARLWAQHHPLEVGLGKINDEWANFVGNFSQGKINKAFSALGNIGDTITKLLFGGNLGHGVKAPGLVNQFVDIGRKLVPAVIQGLSELGTQLGNMFTTAVTGVDWAKTLGDAVGGAVELLLDNQNIVANLAVVAGALAAGMFVLDIFASALGAMLSAPQFLASKAVQGAITVLGSGLLFALRAAMFFAEGAIDLFARGLAFVISSVALTPESAVGKAAFGLGTGIQALIAAGVSIGLFALLSSILKDVLDNLLPGGTRLRFNPETGRMERFASGGIVTRPTIGLLGEAGPEAVIPLRDLDRSPMSGGITINITAGVGNPVEIGREVDRVLRAYRGRAGLPA